MAPVPETRYRPFQLVDPSAHSSRPSTGTGSSGGVRSKGRTTAQGPTPEPTSTSSNGSASSSSSAPASSSFDATYPKLLPDPSTLSAKALGKRAARSVPDIGVVKGRDGLAEAVSGGHKSGKKLKRRRTEDVAHQSTASSSAAVPGTTFDPLSTLTKSQSPSNPPPTRFERIPSANRTPHATLDDASLDQGKKRAVGATFERRVASPAVVLGAEGSKRRKTGGKSALRKRKLASPELGVGSASEDDSRHLASQTPHLPSPALSDSSHPPRSASFTDDISTSPRSQPQPPSDSLPESPPLLPSQHSSASLAQPSTSTSREDDKANAESIRKAPPRRSTASPTNHLDT